MPSACSFRQVDEKHVAAEVQVMQWSPKMDLIAIANVNGEVILYRLSWQKVWALPPAGDGVKVKAMAWRTDGKVLAVGYSSGEVKLCFVENAVSLHTLHVAGAITCLAWVAQAEDKSKTEGTTRSCFDDKSATYLPKLPSFAKSYGNLSKGTSTEDDVEDAKKLKGQKDLNLLVVGSNRGEILLYAYGVCPTGITSVDNHCLGEISSIRSGFLSHDLQVLSLMVETEEMGHRKLHQVVYDTTLLASRSKEVKILAMKIGQILTLLQYVETTIQQMQEASEDILLEMESKMMTLAEEKYKAGGGAVSNDLLKLLLFGTPSDELQVFLLQQLTERGLKKLGHSIETSYSNIQELVLTHLQSVAQTLVYHLTDLQGMSLWYEKFGVLGLSTSAVEDSLKKAGSFMLKALELQQVIDNGMKNFKACFRWLYVVILRLSGEPIPRGFSKMTQQDCNFVAQFLKENFTEDYGSSTSGFKLEKVGQYLKNEDLSDPPQNSGNPWITFLEENPDMAASQMFTAEANKSLVQVQHSLVNSIDGMLEKSRTAIGQSHQCLHYTTLLEWNEVEEERPSARPRISQFSVTSSEPLVYTVFTENELPCHRCYLLRQTSTGEKSLEGVAIQFGQLGLNESNVEEDFFSGNHQIIDIEFYDGDTLSVLLQEEGMDTQEGCPVLAQVPLASLDQDCFTKIEGPHLDAELLSTVDLGPHVENMNFRRLENMKAASFAVSGTRRVACVLFSSRRRVRMFMMDAEEDDDEEDEPPSSQNTTQEGDTSHDVSGLNDSKREVTDDEDKENTSRSSLGME